MIALALAGCGDGPAAASPAPKQPNAVPVTVARAVEKPEPLTLRAIGNVQQYNTVQVKSQVAGQLIGVYFKEGDYVRKGQLLFQIDPQPFQAALDLAKANRAKDAAQEATAELEAQRYTALFHKGVVSREQADQMRTNSQALKATLAADDAQIQTAKLQLSYTKIYSPIDGRTGAVLVQNGNLIKANDVPMVVINQVQPIYVSFSVPAGDLPKVKEYMARRRLPVEAVPTGAPPQTGALTFINNAVDVNTGTIQLKGTFPNRNRELWPGEFVNVTLRLAVAPALVVPTAAVQNSQHGQYVYVVKPDRTVEQRPIVVNRTIGDDTVIQQGLKAGETVVTDGQLRLVPGAKVEFVPPVTAAAQG